MNDETSRDMIDSVLDSKVEDFREKMYEKLDNVASKVIDDFRKEIAYSMFSSDSDDDEEDFVDDGDEEDYEGEEE